MESNTVIECRICGDEIKAEDTDTSPDSGLCDDCMVLQNGAELLINKNPRRAIIYFTDLFMQSRRRTQSEEKLKNCIWESWWNGTRSNCSTRI
jgi:hypothetical protein